MTKRELIGATTDALRADGYKRSFSIPKRTFYITDQEGESCEFHVKSQDRSLALNQTDVATVLDKMIEVAINAFENGDAVSIAGFGTLRPRYRGPQRFTSMRTGEVMDIEGHYLPKFYPGASLKIAAKLYSDKVNSGGGDEL